MLRLCFYFELMLYHLVGQTPNRRRQSWFPRRTLRCGQLRGIACPNISEQFTRNLNDFRTFAERCQARQIVTHSTVGGMSRNKPNAPLKPKCSLGCGLQDAFGTLNVQSNVTGMDWLKTEPSSWWRGVEKQEKRFVILTVTFHLVITHWTKDLRIYRGLD